MSRSASRTDDSPEEYEGFLLPERRFGGIADLVERFFGATIFWGVKILMPWTWFRNSEPDDREFGSTRRPLLWRVYEFTEQVGFGLGSFFGVIIDSLELGMINLGAFVRRILRLGR